MPITRQPVKSSMLKSVGFENGVLEVELHKGGIYRYEGISQEQFDALLAAESVGGHFNRVIKSACTACTKVGTENHPH